MASRTLSIGSSQISYGGISACSSIACMSALFLLKAYPDIPWNKETYEKLLCAGTMLWKQFMHQRKSDFENQTWTEVRSFKPYMFKDISNIYEFQGYVNKEPSTYEKKNFAMHLLPTVLYDLSRFEKTMSAICTIGSSSFVILFTKEGQYTFDSHAPSAILKLYENVSKLTYDIKLKFSKEMDLQFTLAVFSI